VPAIRDTSDGTGPPPIPDFWAPPLPLFVITGFAMAFTVLQAAPPWFVTVSNSVIVCPTLALRGVTKISFTRRELASTETVLLVAGTLCAASPVLSSVPSALPVKLIVPTPDPSV
jgi:hypothetical protein